MNVKTIFGALALTGFAVFTAPAMATTGACTGISLGTSNVTDVLLDGAAADACVVSSVNPQQGASGNTSGFSSAFGPGDWSLLAKMTAAHETATFGSGLDAVNYTLDFSKDASNKSGTWTISVDKAVKVDLVFDIHASNRSDAFFFDDQILSKTPSNNGTWAIHWLNKGNQVPDFSNLTVFARNQTVTTPVPEPETYAMLLAGLGLVGFAARRRRKN